MLPYATGLSRSGRRVWELRLYQRRYLPGQRIHLEIVRPGRLAEIVVDNNDPEKPRPKVGVLGDCGANPG